jgi:DNA-binding beta-propeller fold protein YncE
VGADIGLLRVSDSGGRLAIVASDFLLLVDPATNLVTDSIPLDYFLNDMAFSPDGAMLYAVSDDNGVLVYISVAAARTLRTVFLGSLWPSEVEVTPDGKHAYVAGEENVVRVELSSGTEVEVLEGGGYFGPMEVDPSGRFILLVDAGQCAVRAWSIDGAAWTGAVPLPEGPYDLVMTPDGGLCVLSRYGHAVMVLGFRGP